MKRSVREPVASQKWFTQFREIILIVPGYNADRAMTASSRSLQRIYRLPFLHDHLSGDPSPLPRLQFPDSNLVDRVADVIDQVEVKARLLDLAASWFTRGKIELYDRQSHFSNRYPNGTKNPAETS